MNLFPYYKQMALDSGATDNVDMNTDSIKVLLLNGYTYDSTDKYVSDVLATATEEIARSSALTTPSVTDGTFDADDTTISSVTSTNPITDVVLYKDTGVDASSVVIAHIDTSDGSTALDLNTNGSNIAVTFNASGIFDL